MPLTIVNRPTNHPRLLIKSGDLFELRRKVRTEPFASMVTRLIEDADKDNMARGPAFGAYDQCFVAHRNAFLFLLTQNEKHALKAREAISNVLDSEEWGNPESKGLTLYTMCVYASYAYDHCYNATCWDRSFNERVSGSIRQMADLIFRDGGKEQNLDEASNWQGLRYSAAGIGFLATDDGDWNETALDQCYGRVLNYLRANLSEDESARGWNIEGLGYTYYPMAGGVAPFAIAMQRLDGSKDLRAAISAVRWTLWTCYATLTRTSEGLIRPDFGDDNPGADGEGCYGFAFWFCPPAIQPGLKWWYDRTVGAKGDCTFDSARFGTIASLLHYPSDYPEVNPMMLRDWVDALAEKGGNGYAVFRNNYCDDGDIVAQLYAKLRGARGHSGPDALGFRIVGLNNIWATGGGRYGLTIGGVDVYKRSQNTVYPTLPDEASVFNNNAGRIVGNVEVFSNGSGQVVLQISENNVGTRNHTRRFFADYGLSGAAAAFVVFDTSDNGRFWQFNTIESNLISVSGNTFTITSPGGASLKGTVVHPLNCSIHTGRRKRGSPALGLTNNNFLAVSSDDGCFTITLTLVRKGGVHPAVAGSGQWHANNSAGALTIGDLKIAVRNDRFVKS